MTLRDHVWGIITKVREVFALDRWTLRLESRTMDHQAGCSADPEYRQATIAFDPDRLQTGDDLAEITVHELTHCHVWPLHAVADNLVRMVADSAPKHMRKALKRGLDEEVRKAAETVTTDVGHTYLRLCRRAGILDTPPSSS